MILVKSNKKSPFIREFTIKKQAEKFAEEKHGKLNIIYNWDDMKNRIVKIYRVKY